MQVLLGLLGRLHGQRSVARQLVRVPGRRLDLLAQRCDLLNGLVVRDAELDDDVGRVTGGADEAVVAGLGVAHDSAHALVGSEIRKRAGDRRLELRGAGVRGGVVGAEQCDQRALARAELLVETALDRGRLGVVVEPAAGAQRP